MIIKYSSRKKVHDISEEGLCCKAKKSHPAKVLNQKQETKRFTSLDDGNIIVLEVHGWKGLQGSVSPAPVKEAQWEMELLTFGSTDSSPTAIVEERVNCLSIYMESMSFLSGIKMF